MSRSYTFEFFLEGRQSPITITTEQPDDDTAIDLLINLREGALESSSTAIDESGRVWVSIGNGPQELTVRHDRILGIEMTSWTNPNVEEYNGN